MPGSPSPPDAPAPGAALIVAHGSPSAPDAQEAALGALAARVARHLPGVTVRGATLAKSGALPSALAAFGAARPVVYPLFMSDGWFVSRELPRRLRAGGGGDLTILPPLGLDPALRALCLEAARDAADQAGFPPGAAAVLLAAHGSPSDPRPRAATEAAAEVLIRSGGFREIRTGFVDQPPYIAEAARLAPPALCLPFFATHAGHVAQDLPEALDAAGFAGLRLEPIGMRPEIAPLIAAALAAATGAARDAVAG